MKNRGGFAVARGSFEPRLVVCESTNEYAKAALESGVLYYAREQSSGKGRDGRSFLSQEGGAYFSLCFETVLSLIEATRYPLIAGLAVAEQLRSYGVAASIKWPNDVMVEGRKICGILVERRANFIIVGIGINLDNSLEGLEDRAISLAALGVERDRGEVIYDVAERFAALEKLPFSVVLERYRALCKFGEVVTKEGELLGHAKGLDAQGFLVIETPSGEIRKLLNPVS